VRRPSRYWWPLTTAGGDTAAPSWPPGEGQKVFGYLKKQYRDFEKILQSLAGSGCRAIAHASGLSDDSARHYAGAKLHVSEAPADMKRIGRESDLVLCHAGHSTVVQMLLSGLPLLLLPMYLEQTLTALNVERLGAGIVVNPSAEHTDYGKLITALMEDGSYRERAGQFAERYADLDEDAGMAEIAQRCEEMILGGCCHPAEGKQTL
jgi:UDP:flavonoid glycosyltransferase YjiC (YdhE family)